MTTLLLLLGALLLDRAFGEPPRWHPLVGFGRLAQRVEKLFYGAPQGHASARRLRGALALLCLLAPATALVAWLDRGLPGMLLQLTLLYLAIGWTSLAQHARRVHAALQAGDLRLARRQVGMMVSRDTDAMLEEDVTKATVESVLENGNDALFGAVFWFIVAGAPGVLCYRLSNTLDAMWGYRNDRYRDFGWAAARLDDLLNYLPARLTALGYSLCGQTRNALVCWRQQARTWSSPNAGPVMAAGAGSLGIRLGGPAWYHGHFVERPPLGMGPAATAADIERALRLLRDTMILWLAALAAAGGLWLLAAR